MHPSSMNNMAKMLEMVLTDDMTSKPFTIIDYGGRKIGDHQSYFSLPILQKQTNLTYKGLDLERGPGVDIVLTDPYNSPIADNSIDIVISGQMFEHNEMFWLTFKDIERILKPGGSACIVVPSGGLVHRYPVDCWRFYPDSYAALAKWTGMDLIYAHHDLTGNPVWQDMCGILRKK